VRGEVERGPAGDGKERRVDAGGDGQLLELGDVFSAAAGAVLAVLVLQLGADNGAAILPKKTFDLLADFPVEAGDVVEVDGVIGAVVGDLDEPVGKAAVAYFAVGPRAGAQVDIHPVLRAELDEVAEVAAAGPVELAFNLFMVDPEDIGGDDVDAARLHLENFILPLVLGNAGVMDLAHHRQPRFAVKHKVAAVHLDRVPSRRRPTHMQVAGLGRGDGSARVDGDEVLRSESLRGQSDSAEERDGKDEGTGGSNHGGFPEAGTVFDAKRSQYTGNRRGCDEAEGERVLWSPMFPARACVWSFVVFSLLGWAAPAVTQDFIVGADVSFLRQMEGNGVVFKDGGVAAPGLRILKNHGYNWVRLRVMVDPVKLPNTLAYTIAEAKDAKAMGFKVLLDLHYSDDWADPQHQIVPRAWAQMSHEELVKTVFGYTRDTVAAMRKAGVLPEMVQVGNEVSVGMIWPDGKLPDHWKEFSELLLAGIHGVDKGRGHGKRPEIMIHIDKGGNMATTKWFLDKLAEYRVPYDVVGQSYYPWWQGSLEELRKNTEFTRATYRKDVIVVETAYDWRTGEDFKGKPVPFAQTPEGQRDFLAALNAVARESGCKGIFWWEPAAGGAIAKRTLFDDEHNALPAMGVFDRGVR